MNGVNIVHQDQPPEFVLELRKDKAKELRDVLYEVKESEDIELNDGTIRILGFLGRELPIEFEGFTEGDTE